MRINEHSALSTAKVLLVPYSEHHVPTYHDWMQDEGLRQATASEALSLDEEYSMQQSWRKDADKLTFIICLPRRDHFQGSEVTSDEDVADRMIGDVNLFLSPVVEDDERPEQRPGRVTTSARLVGELEIMVARPEHRGHGLGRAALVAFLSYVESELPAILSEYQQSLTTSPAEAQVDHLRVRIGENNHASIALFEGLGFTRTTEKSNYFGELELQLQIPTHRGGTRPCDLVVRVPYTRSVE